MKTNAPEKIYLEKDKETEKLHYLWGRTPVISNGYEHIEYIRTDAFIEKVERFLENELYFRVEIQVSGTVIPSLTSKKVFIENFRKYMKGE